MATFIQEIAKNFFESLSESLNELKKEKSIILKKQTNLDNELRDLEGRIEKAKQKILNLQNLSVNAMRKTGKFERVEEERFYEETPCGCYLGYYCDSGGCSGPGGTYTEKYLVDKPILEPHFEARQQAREQLPSARIYLNQLLNELKPRCLELKTAIQAIEAEKKILLRSESIQEKCSFILARLINTKGKNVKLNYKEWSEFANLYSDLEDESRVELLHLLISLDHSGNLLASFVSQLHKIHADLSNDLACHLYGMTAIGNILIESEKNQFKLKIFSLDLYQQNPLFEQINSNLVKKVIIDALKQEIQRLTDSSDDWWMISANSTIQSLNRLIDLIQNQKKGHLTYNELLAQWSKEATLTNFLAEKTTRGALINNHRNIFSLFNCCAQKNTKTYLFIQELKNKFGDRLIDSKVSLVKNNDQVKIHT